MDNTRDVVSRMVTDLIGDADEIRAPDVARAVVRNVQADSDLLTAFIDQHVYPMVYEIVLDTMSRWRRQKEAEGTEVILTGEYGATRETIQRKATVRRLRWLQRFEHVGDRHITLRSMGRSELLIAASEREKRAESELHDARFLRAVAKMLKANETVGLRFNDEQLDEIYRTVNAAPVGKSA